MNNNHNAGYVFRFQQCRSEGCRNQSEVLKAKYLKVDLHGRNFIYNFCMQWT